MNRRRFLSILSLPALSLIGGGAFAQWRSGKNPYYEGPVSDHFDGVRFFNPGGRQTNGFGAFLRWQIEGGREAWPESYPAGQDKPPARVAGTDLRVSSIGHASLLVQVAGANILIDPVWSERASPFAFAGPKRVNAPGIAFSDLPPIDLILVSHNHYDHLDLDTLSRLAKAHPGVRIVTPLGNDAIMRAHDSSLPVEAHDWGVRVALSRGASVTLEPAHHWSARGTLDRRMALWAAFVIETPAGKIYHVGDSGYHDGIFFRQAREKHGDFRLAILPIGAYEPRWFMAGQHMNPDEAVRAMLACGAQYALGHHWGTFQLTNEGIERPLEALKAALEDRTVPADRFRTLRPGQAWMVPGAQTMMG